MQGALGQLLNFFSPSMKLQSKRREGSKTLRVYDRAATPLQRVLVWGEVSAEKKAQLQQLHQSLSPFALRRQIDKQLKEIDSIRQLKAWAGGLDCIRKTVTKKGKQGGAAEHLRGPRSSSFSMD